MAERILSVSLAVLPIICTVIIALVGWGNRTSEKKTEQSVKQANDKAEEAKTVAAGTQENLNKLQARLPIEYVRKDDYQTDLQRIHNQINGIDTKIDKVIEILIKGVKANE